MLVVADGADQTSIRQFGPTRTTAARLRADRRLRTTSTTQLSPDFQLVDRSQFRLIGDRKRRLVVERRRESPVRRGRVEVEFLPENVVRNRLAGRDVGAWRPRPPLRFTPRSSGRVAAEVQQNFRDKYDRYRQPHLLHVTQLYVVLVLTAAERGLDVLNSRRRQLH